MAHRFYHHGRVNAALQLNEQLQVSADLHGPLVALRMVQTALHHAVDWNNCERDPMTASGSMHDEELLMLYHIVTLLTSEDN